MCEDSFPRIKNTHLNTYLTYYDVLHLVALLRGNPSRRGPHTWHPRPLRYGGVLLELPGPAVIFPLKLRTAAWLDGEYRGTLKAVEQLVGVGSSKELLHTASPVALVGGALPGLGRTLVGAF